MAPPTIARISHPAQPDQAPPAKVQHGISFHELLSELNPLQYLPVVGTIYRAVTGDTIPEAARVVGSLVVSGLTGGPVGLAMNVGTTLLERATGFDPERMARRLLASLGIGNAAAPSHAVSPPDPQEARPAAIAAAGWTRTQLAAYGVERTADGECRRGAMVGCDVLNGLELARIRVVA